MDTFDIEVYSYTQIVAKLTVRQIRRTRNTSREKIMADTLGLCLKKLRRNLMRPPYSSRQEELDYRTIRDDLYDGLMNHIRDMMFGYENEEMKYLLNTIKGILAISYSHSYDKPELHPIPENLQAKVKEIIDKWSRHEITFKDMTLQIVQEKVKEMLVKEAWYRREETVMHQKLRNAEVLVEVMWYNQDWYVQKRLDKMIVFCEKL